jgi:hypothetical protein
MLDKYSRVPMPPLLGGTVGEGGGGDWGGEGGAWKAWIKNTVKEPNLLHRKKKD